MSTIRDVAKLAGVSTATVSRVLNNDTTYKMTDETRSRVKEAISVLDYKTPVTQRTTITNQSRKRNTGIKIGCILGVTKKKFNDPYFMGILSSIEERMSFKGYHIDFVKTGQELEDKILLNNTIGSDVTGLIIMEQLSPEIYDSIYQNIPHIVGIDTRHREIDNVGYDHMDAADQATHHLIKCGHTDIGFIGGHGAGEVLQDGQRYKGYYLAMNKAGLFINNKWSLDCAWDEEVCAQLVLELIRSGKYPTAFFVASDLMAMATLNALYSCGIKVPEQIAVIGISDIEVAKYSNPPLSTVRIPIDQLGIVAADMLIARIEGYSLLPQKIILPTELIKRAST